MTTLQGICVAVLALCLLLGPVEYVAFRLGYGSVYAFLDALKKRYYRWPRRLRR